MAEPIKLQEQIELITPTTGKQVVIRGYATGRVRQAISDAYAKNMTVEFTGEKDADGSPKTRTVSTGAGGSDATNAALAGMVISLDGRSEDILSRILDLPEDDYDYIKTEVDKAATPLARKPTTDLKNSTTTTSPKA